MVLVFFCCRSVKTTIFSLGSIGSLGIYLAMKYINSEDLNSFYCLFSFIIASACAWTPMNGTDMVIPKDFMIGTATSAYQVEGAWNEDGKCVSIWDTYVHQNPNFIVDHSNGDVAADSYHKFNDDVEALKNLGVDFYRFSISWPRILPQGHVNEVNQAGINYYNNLIDQLKENNIEPVVAMYHWDLPQSLQDLGGWANPAMAEYFEDYAYVLFTNFGDRVKWWITLVEPDNIASGYNVSSLKAPGIDSPRIGLYLATHTLILAHSMAYHLYRNEFQNQKGKIGISLNGRWFEPASNSSADKEAAEMAIQYQLGLFANPIYSEKGDYPHVISNMLDKLSIAQGYRRSRLRRFTFEEVKNIRGTFDFFGLNYYTTRLVKAPDSTGDVNVPDNNVIMYVDPKWPSSASSFLKVVPWGLRKLLMWIKEEYGNPPVFLTENGFSDRGDLEDTDRIKYFSSHMKEILLAKSKDNCNVIGYTYWSLLDNFEWGSGYTEKFGLYKVNFHSSDRTRTPKQSAQFISHVIKTRTLPLNYTKASDVANSSAITSAATGRSGHIWFGSFIFVFLSFSTFLN